MLWVGEPMDRYEVGEGYPGGVENPSPVGETGESLASRDAELERDGEGLMLPEPFGSVAALL